MSLPGRQVLCLVAALLMAVASHTGAFAQTPLIAAAESGDLAALQRALQAGAALEERDARQRTALMAAVQTNQT
ncbi:MAG: ankyrin repeat domain-containing protein, partial [Pseudomonadota bacterium]|nr:ankyrin repeat domain-containing protein [Pseudomonadota bacterium]